MKRIAVAIFSLLIIIISIEYFIGFKNIYHQFTKPKKEICIENFSWESLNYVEAKGYFFASYRTKKTGEYRSKGRSDSSIINDFKLNEAVWDKEGVVFTKEDIDKLFNPEKYPELFASDDFGEEEFMSASACHDPHRGIVFRNEQGCPFAYINICFACNTVTAKPKRNFPGISLRAARLLFKEKGIKPIESYAELLEYSREFHNYKLDEPIYSMDSVETVPEYIPEGKENLIGYFNQKGRTTKYTQEITNDSINISFVVEDNGELNLLELEEEETGLLWLWETKWKPATINGKNVRSRVSRAIYLK